MDLLKGNQEVCLSIKALYDSGIDLLCGSIIHTSNEYKGVVSNYYDLYNEYGELACMDGEDCKIYEYDEPLISFRNDNGETTVYFALTLKEAEIAGFSDVSAGGDTYKVNELKKMLKHEESEMEKHYGSTLKHGYRDTKPLTIDAGGLQCLIDYYKVHDTKL